MKFEDILGQEKVIEGLLKGVSNHSVPHAQLFTGRPGSGAYALALAYAQFLACTDRSEKDSCGLCDSCKRMSTLQHPDQHFSFPFLIAPKKETADAYISEWRELVLDKKGYFNHQEWVEAIHGESKNLIINVNEALSLSSKLWLKSFGGGYKFMFIYEPESMHESAANKLLKLIEEPPEKTLIFLISDKPENIILTIRSRTQLVKLSPLSDEQISEYLAEKFGLSAEEAGTIARLVNGDLGRAVNIAANGAQNQWFPMFRDWMRISYTGDMMKLIPWVDQMNTYGREEQKNFLSYGLEVIRQCLSGNYTEGELQRFSADEIKFAKNFSPFINHTNALDLMQSFQDAFRDIRGNLNAKLVFFDLTVNIHKLIRRSTRA